MLFQAVILAVLSAGALADISGNIFLTAFPNGTECKGTPAGNNVSLPINTSVPENSWVTGCIKYAPDLGQQINIVNTFANATFGLFSFTDSKCSFGPKWYNFKSKRGPSGPFASYCLSAIGEELRWNKTDKTAKEVSTPDWQSVQLYRGKDLPPH